MQYKNLSRSDRFYNIYTYMLSFFSSHSDLVQGCAIWCQSQKDTHSQFTIEMRAKRMGVETFVKLIFVLGKATK